MLNGIDGKIDIKLRPIKVMRQGALDRGQLRNRCIPKPGKMVKWEIKLPFIEQ